MAEKETNDRAGRESILETEVHIGRGVTIREISAFFRELSILLDVGVPLLRGLQIMEGRTHNRRFSQIIQDLASSIEQGGTLATGMAKHRRYFSELSVNVIKAGELGGGIEQSLRRLADFMESDVRFRSKLLYALMYPAFAVSVGVIALIVILVAVIPRFKDVFADKQEAIPAPTKFVIWLSDLLQGAHGLVVILVVIAAIVGIYYFLKKSSPGRRFWDYMRLKFNIPFLGAIGTKTSVGRACGTFALLLRSGVQIIQGLDIVGKTSGNMHIEEAFAKARERVEQGQGLASVLEESGHFPPLVIDMIGIGDEAGALDVVLEKVSANYQEEVDMALEALNRVIEPILIVVMGAIVLFIAVSVYLPYFKLWAVFES